MSRCSLPLLFLAICTVASITEADTKRFAADKLRKKWWPFQKYKSMIIYRINEVDFHVKDSICDFRRDRGGY